LLSDTLLTTNSLCKESQCGKKAKPKRELQKRGFTWVDRRQSRIVLPLGRRSSPPPAPINREMTGEQDKQAEKKKKIANTISLMPLENHGTVAVLPQREEKS